MSDNKPLVLVLGATGRTGQSIVNGLLKSGEFVGATPTHRTHILTELVQRVAAMIRAASLSKPATEQLRAAGIEIREGDVTDDYEKLKEHLQGVDILISAVNARVVGQQREIFRAAKEVGVQRVVPCDWATPGAKGVRVIADIVSPYQSYCCMQN